MPHLFPIPMETATRTNSSTRTVMNTPSPASIGASGSPDAPTIPPSLDEAHLHTLLTCIAHSGIILVYRPDTSRPDIWWSPGSAEMLGFQPTELGSTAEALHELVHPDDLGAIAEREMRLRDRTLETPNVCEYRLRRKDGRYHRIRSIVNTCPPPEQPHSRASVEIIRVLEHEGLVNLDDLKLNEKALSTMLNEIGHPVVLMDAAGIIVQANQAATRLLGTPTHPHRFCPFLHSDDGLLLFPGFLEDVIRRGQPATRELEQFQRWWDVHLVPIRDTKHQVARILLLAQDITRVKVEQAAQLDHERALTRTLVREVHHRIKNHLQGLVGLLRHEAASQITVTELVDSAVTQIQSIAAIHGLLAKSGKTTIDIPSLVPEIVSAHQATSRIPIHFIRDSPVNATGLSEDESIPLAIVIGELLTNAVKHTKAVEKAAVQVALHYPNDSIEITITNAPAQLPDGFHLDQWTGGQSGLGLVFTLLADGRTRLTIRQRDESVVATLMIKPKSMNSGR